MVWLPSQIAHRWVLLSGPACRVGITCPVSLCDRDGLPYLALVGMASGLVGEPGEQGGLAHKAYMVYSHGWPCRGAGCMSHYHKQLAIILPS